jgi:hypothetical protein
MKLSKENAQIYRGGTESPFRLAQLSMCANTFLSQPAQRYLDRYIGVALQMRARHRFLLRVRWL